MATVTINTSLAVSAQNPLNQHDNSYSVAFSTPAATHDEELLPNTLSCFLTHIVYLGYYRLI